MILLAVIHIVKPIQGRFMAHESREEGERASDAV
jgi:hypothetical protein